MVMLLGLGVPFSAIPVSAASPSTDYDSILESIYDEETKTYTMTTADHLLALAYGIKNHGTSGSYYYYGKTFVLGADITLNTGVQDAVAAGNSLMPSAKKRYGSTKVTTPSAIREKESVTGSVAVIGIICAGLHTASEMSIIKNAP